MSMTSSEELLSSASLQNVVLPDVGSITGYQRDLSSIPNIEMGDIMVYLMNGEPADLNRTKKTTLTNSFKTDTLKMLG